jgi:hypothetical protein
VPDSVFRLERDVLNCFNSLESAAWGGVCGCALTVFVAFLNMAMRFIHVVKAGGCPCVVGGVHGDSGAKWVVLSVCRQKIPVPGFTYVRRSALTGVSYAVCAALAP